MYIGAKNSGSGQDFRSALLQGAAACLPTAEKGVLFNQCQLL
jgi:hypothetical protein